VSDQEQRNAVIRTQQKKCGFAIILLVLMGGLVLATTVTSWAEEDSTYKVVMSKNDRLCSHMLAVLNKGLEEYGPEYHVAKFTDAVFSAIAWKPIGLDQGFDYGGDVARFDINNYGRTDVIVRLHTSGVRDVTFQHLYVFDEGRYPELPKKARELEDKAVGSVNIFIGHAYEFRALPQKPFKTLQR